MAQTWDGNGNQNSGGNWSLPANWSNNTLPGASSTALLINTAAHRTITYDTMASGVLGTLSFNQDSAFNNQLYLARTLAVTNTIILGATTGTETITVGSSSTAGSVLNSAGGITLNAGGHLILTATGNGSTPYFMGNAGSADATLKIQGGTLTLAPTAGTTTATTATNTLTGNLSMSDGELVVDNAPELDSGGVNRSKEDRRLGILGSVNITGGTIKSTLEQSVSGTFGSLHFQGLQNTLEPDTFDPDLKLALERNGAQRLLFNQSLGIVQLRGTGEKTLAVSLSCLTTGPLQLFDGNNAQTGSRTTLKLGSDITLDRNAELPTVSLFSNQPEPTTNRLDVGIDTQYFTLDLTKGAGNGIWTPNTSTQATGINTFWQLTGKGVIAAGAFNFNANNTSISLDDDIMLLATRSSWNANAPQANTLVRATIRTGAKPVFRYTGNNFASLVSLPALRTIQVENGTLRIISGAPNSDAGAAPNLLVGGTLEFNENVLLAGTTRLRFYAEKTDTTPPIADPLVRWGQIKALNNNMTYGGELVLDFASARASQPRIYKLFTTQSSAATLSPRNSFSSVRLNGLYTGDLTKTVTPTDKIWSTTIAQTSFTFSEKSGELTISKNTGSTPNLDLLNDKLVVKSRFEPGVYMAWNNEASYLTLVGEDSTSGQPSWDPTQIKAENLGYSFLINNYQRISNFALVRDPASSSSTNRVLKTQVLNSNIAPGDDNGNGRAQGTFMMDATYNRHRWKYRQFISNDFRNLLGGPPNSATAWTDFFEIWTAPDTVPGSNAAGAYRVLFNFEPATDGAEGFCWKLKGQITVNPFTGWTVTNKIVPVPFGRWCEWDITIIKGADPKINPASPARVIVLMRPEGDTTWTVLFNVDYHPTQHPTLIQEGYHQVQPFKNYLGKDTVAHLLSEIARAPSRQTPPDISLYFDDFAYWVNTNDGSYSSWATSALPVNQRGATNDPDRDGIENLAEYVLGGDPNLNDGTKIQPIVHLLPSGQFVYSFKRREIAKAGVNMVVEISPNINWSNNVSTVPIGLTSTTTASASITIQQYMAQPGMESVTVTLPRTNTSRFVRLKVTPKSAASLLPR